MGNISKINGSLINADTASFVTTAQTASYVENAQTASFVNTLNQSVTITGAITASSNISASGYLVAQNITASGNISASGTVMGLTGSFSYGVILKSPNGSNFRFTVDDSGHLSVTGSAL